jgi:hypothetical protein
MVFPFEVPFKVLTTAWKKKLKKGIFYPIYNPTSIMFFTIGIIMIILCNYFPMTRSIPNNVCVNNLQYIILDKQFIQNYKLQFFIAFLETMQRKKNVRENDFFLIFKYIFM